MSLFLVKKYSKAKVTKHEAEYTKLKEKFKKLQLKQAILLVRKMRKSGQIRITIENRYTKLPDSIEIEENEGEISQKDTTKNEEKSTEIDSIVVRNFEDLENFKNANSGDFFEIRTKIKPQIYIQKLKLYHFSSNIRIITIC